MAAHTSFITSADSPHFTDAVAGGCRSATSPSQATSRETATSELEPFCFDDDREEEQTPLGVSLHSETAATQQYLESAQVVAVADAESALLQGHEEDNPLVKHFGCPRPDAAAQPRTSMLATCVAEQPSGALGAPAYHDPQAREIAHMAHRGGACWGSFCPTTQPSSTWQYPTNIVATSLPWERQLLLRGYSIHYDNILASPQPPHQDGAQKGRSPPRLFVGGVPRSCPEQRVLPHIFYVCFGCYVYKVHRDHERRRRDKTLTSCHVELGDEDLKSIRQRMARAGGRSYHIPLRLTETHVVGPPLARGERGVRIGGSE